MSYLWKRPCVLDQNKRFFDAEPVIKKISESRDYLNRQCWLELLKTFEKLQSPKLEIDISGPEVSVGSASDISEQQRSHLLAIINKLIPWRKGPFEICGESIDSEWRSEQKWERIAPYLDGIKGQRVADVGCGNGYYMFKALQFEPEFILGFDPSERFFLAFELLQKFIQADNLQMELLGIEDLSHFEGFFHSIVCMGVLYHQRNPLKALQLLRGALKPKGFLLLEGQIVPGEEIISFFPPERYAKARNVYFLPTVACLKAWLHRVGFEEIEVVSVAKTNFSEQRKTAHAPFESLRDFLDKDDSSKTIEGHPAPQRAIVLARNKPKKKR